MFPKDSKLLTAILTSHRLPLWSLGYVTLPESALLLTAETFENSPQLWSRLAFWLGGAVPGFAGPADAEPFPGPASPDDIADILSMDPEAAAMVETLASDFRAFVGRMLARGPCDAPYYRRVHRTQTIIYSMNMRWHLAEGLSEPQLYFRASHDSAAVMSMLRYVTAQQAAYPDANSTLARVLVKRFEFGEINEDGQQFYGDPSTFFEWSVSEETGFDDHGRMSLDASALLWSAKLSVDPWS